MKILVLDNYDSFTYNLVQYVQEILGKKVDVFRNDEIELEAVADYDAVILSPGPGVPKDAGIMPALIQKYAPTKPIFGVCLGHQAIGEAFGGELINLSEVFHGIETPIDIVAQDDPFYKGLPNEIEVGRYHSWSVKKETLPDCFVVTATDKEGAIMSFYHKEYNVRGVQYHPESVMTEHGMAIIKNWLSAIK